MTLMNRLRTTFATLLLAGAMLMPAVATVPAFAITVDGSKNAACEGIELAGADCGSGAENRIFKLVNTVVNILSMIVGIAAVVMIIISGFKYVTSGGDANSVSSAKNTLIYAIVGIIIVVLAQFIVRFVFNNVK